MLPTWRLIAVSGLALMANAHNADQIECGLVTIKSNVSGRAMADHQLPKLPPRATADPGMSAQDFDSASYVTNGRERRTRRRIEQELHDALKVFDRSVGIDYPRHRTAFGRRTARPRALASR